MSTTQKPTERPKRRSDRDAAMGNECPRAPCAAGGCWGRRLCRRGTGTHHDRSAPDSFRHNMLHEERRRDVFEVYDFVEIIGEGSISTISKVRKKRVGGSARLDDPSPSSSSSSSKGGAPGRFGRAAAAAARRLRIRRRRESSDWVAAKSALESRGRRGTAAAASSSPPRPAPSGGAASSCADGGAQCRGGGRYFALKAIDLRLVKDEYLAELRNEIDMFRRLDHPNIAKAYEAYRRRRHLCVVMELCTGGDLHVRALYSEREAAGIVGKALSAVAYMHKNSVMHRDLKFENILFENARPDAEIKLIDFGLAKKYLSPDHVMTERVGTVYTMAPEVIRGAYGFKADMWSVGVIAYMLLSNTKPFWGKKKRRIVEKIMRCKYNFLGPEWNFVSRDARHFVRSLIRADPGGRPTAEEAQRHPWLTREFRLSDRRPPEGVMDRVSENIIRYADSGEFKKVVLNVVAHKSTAEEIFSLRQVFDQYDRNNDGVISYGGFREALSKFSYTDKELDAMFRSVDFNENGVILYTEFLAAAIEAQGRIEEERLAEAFDRIDCDNTGYISKQNLRSILGKKYTDKYAERLISEVDMKRDGKISYEEFLSLFLSQKNQEICRIYEDAARSEEQSLSSQHEDMFEDALEEVSIPSEERPV